MYANRSRRVSTSGVPRVFDRFGQAVGSGRITYPLSTARGVLAGMAAALMLWVLIAALLGLF